LSQYAEILVDVANRRLDQSYHYLVPENLPVKTGMTVIVTLKNRKVQGLVVRVTEDPPQLDEEIKIRPVEAILEEECLILWN
jgi:primosomal protein N' (replication factor Y)